MKGSVARFVRGTTTPEAVLYGLAMVGFVFTLLGAGLDWSSTAIVAVATVIVSAISIVRARAWAQRLAAAEAEARDAEAKARRGEAEAREELAERQRQAADAIVKTQQYRAELTRMFMDDVSLSEVQQVVYVLSAGESDRYSLIATTTPASERCRWRRVRVKGDGPSESVHAQLLSAGATLLELDDVEGYWSGLVLFDPPIQPGESRQWSLDLLWPRMADPLRRNGTDTVWFYTEIPVSEATIRVKYTQDWVQQHGPAPHGFREISPQVGDASYQNVLGDDVVSWTIQDVIVGQHYMASVERSRQSEPRGAGNQE